MIAFYETREEFETCIRLAETYLSADGTAEKMVRKLMEFYAWTGSPVQVASTLKRCRETLYRELDCLPQPETEELALRLLTRKKTS